MCEYKTKVSHASYCSAIVDMIAGQGGLQERGVLTQIPDLQFQETAGVAQ